MTPTQAIAFFLGQGPYIDFAAVQVTASGSGVTKPAGLREGDLVFVFAANVSDGVDLDTSGGSDWPHFFIETDEISGNGSVVFWKVMNATDVANAWTMESGAKLAVHYRGSGVGSVALKAGPGSGGGGETTFAGFTKAAKHLGVLNLVGSVTDGSAVPPPGFADRYSDQITTGVWLYAADLLSGYVDGAPMVWEGDVGGWAFEVTAS